MADNESIQLLESWVSPFSCRVVWALKLKDIPYEAIQEDLTNKSDLLLEYNPVYKKIPVLVHGGKPICESTLILEYIEETWPLSYALLPSDPCERALARFWIKFVDDKGPNFWMIYRTKGQEQEKAVKESLEILQTVEDNCFSDSNKKFFGGEQINMVDIAFGALAHWLGVIEDVCGVKLLEASKFPRMLAWAERFKRVSIVKENLPDRDRLFEYLKARREMLLLSN